MISDYFKFSLEGIKKRKLRSSLTIIGIFIGIAAVVSLISLGQGLQVAIEEQFQQAGSDKIFIVPGSGFGPPGTAIQKLSEHDKELIDRVRGVGAVGGITFKFSNVKFNDKVKFLPVHGFPLEDKELEITSESHNLRIKSGRNLKEGDKNKAVVGFRLSEQDVVFGKPIKLRDIIELDGEKFKVVGTAEKIGNPPDDSVIYIPIETSRELFGIGDDELDFIFVKVGDGFDVGEVAERIEEKMRKDRGLKEGEENFQVETLENILETFSNIFGIVQAVIIGIAAISLLVGGIGIMNTMYMSVAERTKEIGIMKAIGAKNSHILRIFLIESGAYGLFGGTIGVLIGVGIAKLTEYGAGKFLGTGLLMANVTPPLIISALLFSFIIGTISGIAPAYKASKLNPVDALRYE